MGFNPFKAIGDAVGYMARGGPLQEIPVVGDVWKGVSKVALPIVAGAAFGPAGAAAGRFATGLGEESVAEGMANAGLYGAGAYGASKLRYGDLLGSMSGGGGMPSITQMGAPGGAAVNRAAPAMAGGASIPDALKWGQLLTGGANLLGAGYDIYSGERAAKRARNVGDRMWADYDASMALERERLGTRTDRTEDRRRRLRGMGDRLSEGLNAPLAISRGY